MEQPAEPNPVAMIRMAFRYSMLVITLVVLVQVLMICRAYFDHETEKLRAHSESYNAKCDELEQQLSETGKKLEELERRLAEYESMKSDIPQYGK